MQDESNQNLDLHWKKVLIREEFLKLYFDAMGVSNLVNIRRLTDLYNFDKVYTDEQLLFAIVKINEDSQYYTDLKKNYIDVKELFKGSGIKILQPFHKKEMVIKEKETNLDDKENQINGNDEINDPNNILLEEKTKKKYIEYKVENDSGINFLELAFTGFMNQKNPKLLNGPIKDFLNRFDEKYDSLNDQLNFEELAKILESDNELNKRHNKIVTDIFQDDLETIHYDNNSFYSIFFGYEGQLIEFIPSINILRIIEKDGVTDTNIGEKMYKFITNINNTNNKKYKELFYFDDITLFCENKEKSNEDIISSSMMVFFIVLLSTILFLINFLFFIPQQIFYIQRQNLYNLFKYDDLDLLYSKALVTNFIKTNFFEQIFNKNNTYNYNLSNSKIEPPLNKPPETDQYKYVVNSNIFSGMTLNFKIGKEDPKGNKLFQTTAGYFGQKPKIDKTKSHPIPKSEDSLEKDTYQIFFDTQLQKNESSFESIMNESLTELYINIMLYNNDYEIALIERVKFKFDTIGKIEYSRNFEGIKMFLNKGKIKIALIILNIFYLLSVIYDTFRVIRLFTNHIINFFKLRINTFEASDFIDMITSILAIVSIIWFYCSILLRKDVFPIVCEEELDFVKWIKIGRDIRNYRVYTSICMFLLFVKLLIFFYRSFPALGIVFDTFSKASIELFSLFFLIFVILIGLFFMFHGVFGGYTHSYYELGQAFLSVYMLFMGIFYYDFDFEYIGESAFITPYLLVVFFIVFNIILCNVFLCLIISTFKDIKNKKQMLNDAVFMMTIESALNLYQKLKNLLLCRDPEDIIKEEEKKRKEKEEKEQGKIIERDKEKEKEKDKEKGEETGVEMMSKMAKKNYYKIIKYNLSNLDCLSFFKKNLTNLEDFERKKENNFKIIRKNILKDYVEELKLNASKDFDTLTDAILYIIFIAMSIAMVYTQLRLDNREKIQYYAYSHVLEKYFSDFKDDFKNQSEMKEIFPQKFFKTIYDCENNITINKEFIPGYTFFQTGSREYGKEPYFRITSRLYNFIENEHNYEKRFYPYRTKGGSGFLKDKKCPYKYEFISDISLNRENIKYYKKGDNYTINSCSGYVYMIFDKCPYNESDFNNYNDIISYSNLGRTTLDFFIISQNYDFIIYFVINLFYHPSGAMRKQLFANIIPVNRFITYNDFNITVITIVCYILFFYFFFKILYSIWLLIREQILSSYYNSGNYELFKDSPLINKFYQFNVSNYQNEKGFFLIIKIIFFSLINFIWKTVILCWFIITSIIRYITEDMFNFLDLFSSGISLSMFILWFYIIKYTNELDLNQIYSKKNGDGDYNLFRINHLYKLYSRYINWSAINLFIIFVRLIQYLKFSKSIYLVFAIFEKQKLTIILYLIFLFIINLGFVFFGYGLFSQDLKTFQTIGSGLLDVFVILAGKIRPIDVSYIQDKNFNPLFLFFFTTINYLVLLNFFYSILIEGYHEVKSRQVKNLGNDSTNYNILATILKILREKLKIFKGVCKNYQKKLYKYMDVYQKNLEIYENEIIDYGSKKTVNRKFLNILEEFTGVNEIEDPLNKVKNKSDNKENNNSDDDKNLTDQISIYHKIIIYIGNLLNTEFDFVEKLKKKKTKHKIENKINNIENDNKEIVPEQNKLKDIKWKSGFLTTFKHNFKSKNNAFFKPNLFDKYYYYFDSNIDLYYKDRRDKPDTYKFNKNRIPRFSKECFLDQLENIRQKDFFMIPSILSKFNRNFNTTLPCLSINKCYLSNKLCEKCKENQELFDKLSGEIYDLVIKYFYLPDDEDDLDIYLGYYIHTKRKSKNNIDLNNLGKLLTEDKIREFWNKVVEKINQPFKLTGSNIKINSQIERENKNENEENKKENKKNKENKKENEENKNENEENDNEENDNEENESEDNKKKNKRELIVPVLDSVKVNETAYTLYYKYLIWSTLYSIFISKDKKLIRKIRDNSKCYKIVLEYEKNLIMITTKGKENEENDEIDTNSNNISLYLSLFFNLYELNKETWDKEILEYDLPKNSSIMYILQHIFQNEKINVKDIFFEKEKFEKSNSFYFNNKYLLNENEKIKDYLLEEPDKLTNEEILKFENYPIIFPKIWTRLSNKIESKEKLDELRNLFLGYNELVDESSENKIDFIAEMKEKDFLKKYFEKLDVFKFLSPEEKAEITLMFPPVKEFVNQATAQLKKTNKESNEKIQKIEKINSFQDLLKYFRDYRVNIIEKHKIFFTIFEQTLGDIKTKLSNINHKYDYAYHKFLKRENDSLEPINKIILSEFYNHLIEKERFDLLKLSFKTQLNVKKTNNLENDKNIGEPIFERISEGRSEIIKDNDNDRNGKNNIMKNPFLWMLSLNSYNYFDVCQKIKDDDVREFYLELYVYIYDEEEDKEDYYLKRKVKLNFIEKYDKYIEYCKLRENIEKKIEQLNGLEKELDEGINYLEKRKKQYDILLKNWDEQKNILEDWKNENEIHT